MQSLIYRLGYVALSVADLDGAIADTIQVLGLSLVSKTADRALLTSNERHAELIFYRGDRAEVRQIGLEVIKPDAVTEVERRAREAGLRVISVQPSLSAIGKSATFASSEGHVFEVHTPMPRDQSARYVGPGIHPQFIDHVNLTAVEPEKLARELQTVLDMRISERTAGYELVWLRAADGRHHTVAISKGATGIHHHSWQVKGFDDFKRLADGLDALGRPLSWGPGRHGAGDNLFAYYVSAPGFTVECTAEMEMIGDPDRQTRVVDLSDFKMANRWGSLPSPEWHSRFHRFTPVVGAT